MAVIVGAVSGATCAAIMAFVLCEKPEAAAPAPLTDTRTQQDLSELKAAVDALRADLARLELTLRAAGTSPDASPARLVATTPGPDNAQLMAALQAIVARLDAGMPQAISTSPDPARFALLRAWVDRKQDPPREGWYLWTEAQVLAAYGPPSGVSHNEHGTRWMYHFGDGQYVQLVFGGGRVVDTFVQR